MPISERIREIRGRMSRKEFEQRTGINQQTIYDYEKGRSKPSFSNIKKISEKFKINEEWLYTGLGPKGNVPFGGVAKKFVIQHNNQGNNVGITLGGSFLNEKNKEDEDVTIYKECAKLKEKMEEKDELIVQLQNELLALHKKYAIALEKLAGV